VTEQYGETPVYNPKIRRKNEGRSFRGKRKGGGKQGSPERRKR